MPIIIPAASSGSYSGPSFGGTPTTCALGNQQLPNGQGVMDWLNLNDEDGSWYWQDITLQSLKRQLGTGHQTWWANDVWQSEDRLAWTLTLPTRYKETSAPLGAAIAQLTQCGQQWLTFDGTTGGNVKLQDRTNVKLVQRWSPFIWNLNLEFQVVGYWRDMTATTTDAQTLTGSVDGTVNSFSIDYAGAVWTSPYWIIATNSDATITGLTLENAMSGDVLVVTMTPGLAPTTLYIDCGQTEWSVTDEDGNTYDVQGSFPQLYPPPGQSNPIEIVLATSESVSEGTAQATYTNRWELA